MMIKELFEEGKTQVDEASAKYLLAHALKAPLADIYIRSNNEVPADAKKTYENYLARRKSNEPLWYIVGTKEFYGLEFEINENVLVPRPETEFLVERAYAHITRLDPAIQGLTLLDMGTGSGCIGISLAKNLPNISVTATDVSAAALKIARANAEKNGVNGISFIESDLFDAFKDSPSGRTVLFDVIVANLPYVPAEDLPGTALDVHHYEPRVALDGGKRGIEVYNKFFAAAPKFLKEKGAVFLEVGYDQKQDIQNLGAEFFPDKTTTVEQDYSGHDRYVKIV